MVINMANRLAEFIKRAQNWPEEVQEQAIASLQSIEQEMQRPYELTQADRRAIDRGLMDATAGRFASDEEVARLFARFRSR
jgi:predicted transcriptional regulator